MSGIIGRLQQQAELRPYKTAVSDEHTSLTFSQLYSAAGRFAYAISDKTGADIGAPVILFCEKSVRCYTALMGVLMSGSCYAPLDIRMPPERLRAVVKKLSAKAAVTTHALAQKLTDAGFDGALIYIEDITDSTPEAAPVSVNADMPAYILFTSGSTGEPKGVVLSRRAVSHHMNWQTQRINLGEDAVLGNQAPFFFDASMPDIFTPLFTGAELHIIPERLFLLPNRLTEYINAHGINTLIWVPSALMLLSSAESFADMPINGLRTVIFCGEVLPALHFNRWRRLYPEAMFVNMYGPTEAAYGCTYHIADHCCTDGKPLPIGIPCEATRILLLDEHGTPSDTGELCIIGERLADGYLCDAETTTERFTISPDGERMYRTGDLARRNENGELEFLGRLDRQIKKQGYRIELGEIEAAAYSCGGVLNAHAMYDKASASLLLFCVTDGLLGEKALFSALKMRLPSYMLPSRIKFIKEMPLTPNGKTDERQLIRL